MLGAGLALFVATAVVGLTGSIGTLALLVSTLVPLIFLPTLLPFLVLAAQRQTPKAAIAIVAAPLVLGWAYVIYVDSRPYVGGGASMAVMLGWAACALSTLFALLALLATPLLKQRRA